MKGVLVGVGESLGYQMGNSQFNISLNSAKFTSKSLSEFLALLLRLQLSEIVKYHFANPPSDRRFSLFGGFVSGTQDTQSLNWIITEAILTLSFEA